MIPARIPVSAQMLAGVLVLPPEVSIVGCEMDLRRGVITLFVTGTPHDGMDLAPSFTTIETGMVELTDWGVETRAAA